MSKPFFGPQGRNINLDSLSFTTINTGFAYIDSTGTVTKKLISTNEIDNSVNLPGVPTTATASKGTNTTQIATTEYVHEAIADLVDLAPEALNTLNELSAALNDDENFSTTVTNSIASKVSLTGNETISGTKTFSDTMYIRSGFNLKTTPQIITASISLTAPLSQFYAVGMSSNSPMQVITLPNPTDANVLGAFVTFKRKTTTNGFILAAVGSGSHFIPINSVVPSATITRSADGIYNVSLICDGTHWCIFSQG